MCCTTASGVTEVAAGSRGAQMRENTQIQISYDIRLRISHTHTPETLGLTPNQNILPDKT